VTLTSPSHIQCLFSLLFQSDLWVLEGLHICTQWPVHSDGGGGGDRWLMLLSAHWRRPYPTCSYVIRIVFSLLMSSSSGGLSRPPAVRQKLARTPWGIGLVLIVLIRTWIWITACIEELCSCRNQKYVKHAKCRGSCIDRLMSMPKTGLCGSHFVIKTQFFAFSIVVVFGNLGIFLSKIQSFSKFWALILHKDIHFPQCCMLYFLC
jgi:hypothetical protein